MVDLYRWVTILERDSIEMVDLYYWVTKLERDPWKRPWDSDERITRLNLRLDNKQEALGRGGIIVLLAEKVHHYLMQMFASNLFDQPMMTEREKKQTVDQTYANAILFFQQQDGVNRNVPGEQRQLTSQEWICKRKRRCRDSSIIERHHPRTDEHKASHDGRDKRRSSPSNVNTKGFKLVSRRRSQSNGQPTTHSDAITHQSHQ